jgi:hypothetical protein
MLHVFERMILLCPYAWARDHLAEAIEEASSGISIAGASVRFERGSDPLGSDEPWHVVWKAAAGTDAADFSGSLAVRLDSAHRSGVLEISGDCAPRDAADFNMEAGTMLASMTARELLRHLGAALEERYKKAVFLA